MSEREQHKVLTIILRVHWSVLAFLCILIWFTITMYQEGGLFP
jgi:hypothetical protein